MYFRENYEPIPALYNLLVHMLWRHPEEVELDKVKVVHFCAAVSILLVELHLTFCTCSSWVVLWIMLPILIRPVLWENIRDPSHGNIQGAE